MNSRKTGVIAADSGKFIYVYGIAEVRIADTYTRQSYIGVNLDTGKIDEVSGPGVFYRHLSELTDSQETVLAEHIPIRQRLSKMIMTVSAQARSGKDTLADLTQGKVKCLKRSLADPIRLIAYEITGPVSGKNREMLILVGQGLRREDPNIWIKTWLRQQIENEKLNDPGINCGIVVPDVRQPNEFTFFKSLGALTVKIEADETKRLETIARLDGEAALNEALLKDETESHVTGFETDLTLFNDYNEYFAKDVEDMVVRTLKERGW